MQANQENIQIFEGFTCVTLGTDDDAATPEHTLTRKVRHPMRDIKLAMPRAVSKAYSHPHLKPHESQQAATSDEHVQCTLGYAMPTRKRRIVSLQRSGTLFFK